MDYLILWQRSILGRRFRLQELVERLFRFEHLEGRLSMDFTILFVEKVEEVLPADKLLGFIAQHPFDRRAFEQDGSVRAKYRDCVERVPVPLRYKRELVPSGWRCPGCSRVFAPDVKECGYCNEI